MVFVGVVFVPWHGLVDPILGKRAVHGQISEVSLMALRLVQSGSHCFGPLDRVEVRKTGALSCTLLFLLPLSLRGIIQAGWDRLRIRFVPVFILRVPPLELDLPIRLKVIHWCALFLVISQVDSIGLGIVLFQAIDLPI